MNDLPSEILLQIFILLHQNDKLECMTVCRRWAITIENSSLFLTVRISDMNQMNKLIAKVQQEPSLGAKIERLILNVDPDHSFKMNNLPFYLPNVRSFSLVHMTGQSDNYYMSLTEKLAPQHPWYRHIEHITEYSTSLLTRCILSSGICPFLKTIMISGSRYSLDNTFISLLANAPALTTLCMIGFILKTPDLELLHKLTPLLRSLSLIRCRLGVDIALRYLDIKPATSMKKLFIKSRSDASFEVDILLLQYINKKYINLSELSYSALYSHQPEEDLKKFYKEGFSPLMKSLGSQLEKIALTYEYQKENIFKILDDNDCKVKRLKLGTSIGLPVLEKLVQSNQVRFIQALTIMYISEFHGLKCLEALESLKELILYSPSSTWDNRSKKIKLGELLEFVGHSLESLQIEARYLISGNYSIHRSYPLLKNLTFDGAILPALIDKFISQSFPQLKKLTLKSCDFTKKKKLVIPNIDLSRFEMIQRSRKGMNINLAITTLKNDGEERFYTAKSTYPIDLPGFQDENIYPATKSQVYDKAVMGSPYFKLVCNSVHYVFMVDYWR